MNLFTKYYFIICYYFCIIFCSNLLYSQEINIVNGVKMIINKGPQKRDKTSVELKFIRQIGEFNSLDDNFIFGGINDLAVDEQENIYLVDYQNFRIQKFDSEGRFLKTYGSGQKGQGPAEFEYPSNISIGSDGSIYISDYKKQLLIVLNQDGSEQKRFMPESTYFARFMLNSKNQIITDASNNLSPEEVNRMQFQYNKNELHDLDFNPLMFAILDNAGKQLREFGQKKIFEERRMNDLGNQYYSAIDKEDNFYVSFEVQNRIEKYSSEGKLIMRIERALNFEETNKMELIRQPGTIPTIKWNYISFGIGVDSSGRIIVLTVTKQVKKIGDPWNLILEVYDDKGILQSYLPVPGDFKFPKFKIFKNKIYFIDNTDELAVFIYEIVEK